MASVPRKRSVYFQGPRLYLIEKELKKTQLLPPEYIDELEKMSAVKMLEIVRGHIRKQDLPWKELSKKYIKFKERHDLYSGHWIETGELEYLLGVHKNKDGHWYVGGAEGQIHKGSDLPLNILIQIHEFGSYKVGIPARPLFRPAAKELREYIDTDIKKLLTRQAKSNWKKLMKKLEKYAVKK